MPKDELIPLPWQHDALAGLDRSFKADRMGHALLVHGRAGLGKRRLAQVFSAYLLCREPRDAQPCGVCSECQLVAAGNHPDWRWITPEDEKKNILVDQIRALGGFLYSKSQRGGRRIAVIEPAEAMNRQAANALLKALEEPPSMAHLVLISHQPSRLLPTVRSRCQSLAAPSPTAEVAEQWLGAFPEAAAAARLLPWVGQAPLKALSLAQAGENERLQGLLSALHDVLVRRAGPVEAAARTQGDRGIFLDLWWQIVHTLAQQRITAETPNRDLGRLQALAGRIDLEQLLAFQEMLDEARRLGTHPLNQELALEELWVQWSKLRVDNKAA